MQAKAPFTRKQFFKYTLLPEFGLRLRDLIGNGFGNLAYLMALIFNTTGLIPNSHTYLQPASVGKYGIRHVLSEASSNVKFDRNHIDQVLIYFAILTGIILLALQFIVLIFSIITNPAFAGGGWYESFFVTPYPEDDVAFRMMTLVFGVDIYGGVLPTQPIHVALYALFEFYSIGMLIVGSFIILYFATTIIAETANTGVPFGKRFSHAWVPIRLIVFFGLLIPLPDGLNGAQWITLSVAKYGSSLATNGWLEFNYVVNNPLGSDGTLVARPNAPEVQHVPAFMMLAKTCQWAEGRKYGKVIDAYVIHGPNPGDSTPLMGLGYGDALALTALTAESPAGNIVIRFGVQGGNVAYSGGVSPDCGELVLQTTDVAQPGSYAIQAGYFGLIQMLWADGGYLDAYARNFTFRFMSVIPRDPFSPMPAASFRGDVIVALGNAVELIILQAVGMQLLAAEQGVELEIARLGWAGAGIWYNRIAEQNGALTTAAMNTPIPQLYPRVMEFIRQERMANDRNVLPRDRFRPTLSNGDLIDFELEGDADIARVLNNVFTYWESRNTRNDARATHAMGDTDNTLINVINSVLGTEGLFDMCQNTDIHPLAQLSAVGKGLVESGIRNLAISAGFGLFGGTGLVPGSSGAALDSLSGFYGTIAGIGITIGFVLFYVLPFMPFIYFFFAVGGWVKSVFEAMVGVPLWALAHLRIDAEGLPGQAAASGYMLLLEVFLRPIMIIFGLLASIVIFAAQVKVLNEIFYLAVSSITGSDPDTVQAGGCATGSLSGLGADVLGELPGSEQFTRNVIDEFFFTIIYAVIVYMMGMASFKLIDLIPNNMMRWFGSGTSSFNDDNAPSRGAESMMKYSTIGMGAISSQLSSGLDSVKKELKGIAPEVARRNQNELMFLFNDDELLPAHTNKKTEVIRDMEQKFNKIDEEVDESDDPRFRTEEQKIAEKRRRKQVLFDTEYRSQLDTLDSKEQRITNRIDELMRGGTRIENLPADMQAKYRDITSRMRSNATKIEDLFNRHGVTR